MVIRQQEEKNKTLDTTNRYQYGRAEKSVVLRSDFDTIYLYLSHAGIDYQLLCNILSRFEDGDVVPLGKDLLGIKMPCPFYAL